MKTSRLLHSLSNLRLAALISCGLSLTALAQSAESPVLKVRAERADPIYAVDERVTFKVTLERDGAPMDGVDATWTLSKDGRPPVNTGAVTFRDGVAELTGSLDEPGFLQCKVVLALPGEPKPITALAGAGVAPLEIKPSLPAPIDFESFWAKQKQALAQLPANVQLTPVKSPSAAIEVFDLQADCLGGAPVSGYLARPADAKRGSLPAILTLHGAGVRDSQMSESFNWAKNGLLALDINAHGLPNGRPAEYYADLSKGELNAYNMRGRESRDESYFLGMFLRVLRALDALADQPEWDGRTLIVRGTSQGGAQSIVAAGLDSRVTFFVAGVPAMADHTGAVVGRAVGWPKLVPAGSATDAQARIQEAARYYDMVNFAALTKAPAYFTVGFIDTTCPPTSVFAAYNAVPGPKAIFHDVEVGHQNSPEASRLMREAVLNHVRMQAGQTSATSK